MQRRAFQWTKSKKQSAQAQRELALLSKMSCTEMSKVVRNLSDVALYVRPLSSRDAGTRRSTQSPDDEGRVPPINR